MKDNEKCVRAISMRPYKYMGGCSPKESKNRQKVKKFLWICPILLCLIYRNSILERCGNATQKVNTKKEKRVGSLEAALSRTRGARIPTVMLFFLLSQVSHEDETRGKKAEKKLLEKVMKNVFFLVVYCVFRGTESTKY